MEIGAALRRMFPARSTGIAMVFSPEQLEVAPDPRGKWITFGGLDSGITYSVSLDGNRKQRRAEASRRRRG